MIEEQAPGATPLDPDEVEGLLHPHVTTKRQLDELEQANIQEGLLWLERQRKPELLSETFIKRLHVNLFGKVWTWAGQFRWAEKNIGVDPLTIPAQLRTLLDDTRNWIENDTYQPLEIAARIHHRMVWIHLFPNGNGRHARIFADALLTRQLGHKPIDWSAGESLLVTIQRRDEYIHALREADKHNIAPLLRFVGA